MYFEEVPRDGQVNQDNLKLDQAHFPTGDDELYSPLYDGPDMEDRLDLDDRECEFEIAESEDRMIRELFHDTDADSEIAASERLECIGKVSTRTETLHRGFNRSVDQTPETEVPFDAIADQGYTGFRFPCSRFPR